MNRTVRATLASAALAALLAGCGAGVLPQVHSDADRLPLAQQLYAKGDYALALEVLTPFTTSGTGSANVDRAIYLMGMCHLGEKEWAGAQGDFERLLRDYPESDSAASAAFRLGEAYFGQSRGPDFDQEYTLKALDQWMSYRRDHPDHWLAGAAAQRIAECRTRLATKLLHTGDLYLKLGDYRPAQVYFRNVIGEYSETPIYGDALVGLALADARLGARDSALASLKEIEQEFAGRPLADKAAEARRRILREKPGSGANRRLNKPNEPPPPAAAPGVQP